MKKLVVVISAAVLLATAVTGKLWLDLRGERQKADELATRVTAAESLRIAQASLPAPSAPVAPAADVTGSQAAAAPASVVKPAAIQQPATGTANPPAKGMVEAMARPEVQDATLAMMRGMMAQMYPDIEQEVGLTRQEKEKLFDLMASEGVMDSAALMMGGARDAAATREMQRKVVESERAQEAKVAALLGSKYSKWEDYQSTAAARQQVDALRRSLGASGTPLSETQSVQLLAAFAAEQKRSGKETREWSTSSAAINSPNMMQETMERSTESMLRQVSLATPILDPEQMERYKRQVEQQTALLRATMGMMGAGSKP